MATRDVIVRLFGDDKDLAAKLKDADLKLSAFARANPTAKLSVNDANASRILDDMKARLGSYGRMVETARLKVNDTQALAELDRLELKMALVGKRMDGLGKNMDTSGLARARTEMDAIGRTVDRLGGGGGGSSRGGFLSRLFGGGRGGGGGGILSDIGGAASSGGSVGSGVLSSVGGASNAYTGAGIGALITLLASLTPALLPLGIGGGVGIGGAAIATMLGKTGQSKIAADEYALQKALASTSNSASNKLTVAHDRAQLAKDQGLYGGFAPFGKSVSGLASTAMDTLAGAFTSKGAGGGSFLTGLTGIFKELGTQIKSTGPLLGQMFRASLPFLSAFVKELGPMAKVLFPALVQVMKQITPLLPSLMHGFLDIVEGIAGFIKALGPGMKASTAIFRAVAIVIKDTLGFLGVAFSVLAIYFDGLGRAIKAGVILIIDYFKLMYRVGKTLFTDFTHAVQAMAHSVANEFDRMRHDISHIFDDIRHATAAFAHSVANEFDRMRHDIASIFNGIVHFIESAWNTVKRIFTQSVAAIWSIESAGFGRVISLAAGLPGRILRALGNLGSLLYNAGRNIIQGLINGITSMIGSIGSAMGGIASTIRSFLPFSPAKQGPLSGMGSPDIAGRKVASMLASGIKLGSHEVSAAAHGMALSIPSAFNQGYATSAGRGIAGVNPGGQIQIAVSGQESDLVKAIVKSLRYEIRSNGGGNVQAHLGWGSA
jgi:hypothetical protein